MMRQSSILLGALLGVLATLGPALALDGSGKGNGAEGAVIQKDALLTLRRCIEIALKRQPNIMASKSTVDANRSKVGQARANYYPRLDISGGYSRYSPVSGAGSASNAFDQYTSSAALTQNIYDFGKTPGQVKVQKFNLDASRADLENTADQTVFNVKQAYYDTIQAQRARDVAEDAVRQFRQHLEQARGFYEVGTKPKFDVTKAEVDLSNARLNLIKAENALKIARVNLNNAMGVPAAPAYEIVDNLAFRHYEMTLQEARRRAFKNRPDLQALIAKRKASAEAIAVARTGYYPTLSGNAAYNWSGSDFPLDHGWDAGVTLTVPLFSGFLTKHQVGEAVANLKTIKANEESLRQSVVLDVQQAYLNLQEAESSVPAAELAVKQARENLDLANGRYVSGVGSPIEVTDAQVSYISAQAAYIQALRNYKVGQAGLEKAMGER